LVPWIKSAAVPKEGKMSIRVRSECRICGTQFHSKKAAKRCGAKGRREPAYRTRQQVWYTGPLLDANGNLFFSQFCGIAEIVDVHFRKEDHAPLYEVRATASGRALFGSRVPETALSKAPLERDLSPYVTKDRSLRAIFREENSDLPSGRVGLKGLPAG
jgi:hypothetical protein